MPQFKGQYAVCDKIVKFTQIYVDRIFGACIKFFQFVATFSDSSHPSHILCQIHFKAV